MPSIVRPEAPTPARISLSPTRKPFGPALADAALLVAFLGLGFLLGAFPQKDTDLWFHLRTGQIVRETWQLPQHDIYTYTVPDRPYIDLHWAFEVGASWLFERGGMVTLNLAKCVVTTLGLFLLITARRRQWPLWSAILAWLPALFLLGGRMYVRPETLTFVCLAAFLAILSRWDRFPALTYLLIPIQALWTNIQGLFILGPILLTFALADAALQTFRERRKLPPERRRWWRITAPAAVLTFAACLANPYGLQGTFFPIQLASTMSDPIFHDTIAELTPIPEFIHRHGLSALPLQIHLAVLALGTLSFLLPWVWNLLTPTAPPSKPREPKPDTNGKSKPKPRAPKPPPREATWQLSPFRLLLFGAFSYLSLQATRNSHQFAAVAGTVTAWNFAEWAGAIPNRRALRKRPDRSSNPWPPRLLTFATLVLAYVFVGTGTFYQLAGEGRTLGLGEEPLWYPHEAAKFAGRDDLPDKLLGIHIGLPALYEYYHGPKRKVYADPRLEVMGVDLYERYMELTHDLSANRPNWEAQIEAIGNPTILVDNVGSFQVGGTLLGSPRMRCVYFDPIAAVFVPEAVAKPPAVDFLARHFRPDPATTPSGPRALNTSAQALWSLANTLRATNHIAATRPLVPLGLGHARRALETDPDSPLSWKLIGQLEAIRDPLTNRPPSPRFRLPLNPILDLPALRATHALKQSLDLDPDAPAAALTLADSYRSREMLEPALPLLDGLAHRVPTNPSQRTTAKLAADLATTLRNRLGPIPQLPAHPNAGDLDAAASTLLAGGRPQRAADLLEQAGPTGPRPWPEADRLATLRLHLGQPAEARTTWQTAATPPQPALRPARVALTHLVEGNLPAARASYQEALALAPNLFEARYGLALLETDAGNAPEALKQAEAAQALAPNSAAESATQALAEAARPYTLAPPTSRPTP